MKKTKMAAAASALLLLTGCSAIDSLITPKIEYEAPVPPKIGTKNECDSLADDVHETVWYDQIIEHLLDEELVFVVDGKLGNDQVSKTLAMLHTDHPEIFWLGRTYYGKIASDGSEVGFKLLSCIEEDDLPKMRRELDDKVKEILDGIPAGISDYEKVVYIHDYIVDNTRYDYKGAKADEESLIYNPYGCLVNGKAVCEGYAEAFTLLMNELGIESGVCTGSNHAWNYVKLDGEYYWLDATWDDVDGSNPHVQHTYCLVTDDQLLRSRSFANYQYYVPDCTSVKNCWLNVNGGLFDTFDLDTVLDYMNSCTDKGHCEMMFGSFEEYEKALASLLGESKLYKADWSDSENMKYYRTDQMFYIEFLW